MGFSIHVTQEFKTEDTQIHTVFVTSNPMHHGTALATPGILTRLIYIRLLVLLLHTHRSLAHFSQYTRMSPSKNEKCCPKNLAKIPRVQLTWERTTSSVPPQTFFNRDPRRTKIKCKSVLDQIRQRHVHVLEAIKKHLILKEDIDLQQHGILALDRPDSFKQKCIAFFGRRVEIDDRIAKYEGKTESIK